MSADASRPRDVLQGAVLLAVAPPLVCCIGALYAFGWQLPSPGPWLFLVGLAGAGVGLVTGFLLPRGAWLALSRSVELLVRYALVLMLLQFALNKLIPGQFLLYNRDFDLPLIDVPARKLAWHFLGHSQLYNGFIASVELVAGLLLCSRRTVWAGLLLSLATLTNVVVIDAAFGLRGALPIASTMAATALALFIVHTDARVLRDLVWRRDERTLTATRTGRRRLLWLITLAFVLGYPLYTNVVTRRGLNGQVPPAGRWEVLECGAAPPLALCRSEAGPAILYIEIGQWGQLVIGAERRNASFTYDKGRGLLEVRIAKSGSTREPEVVLSGIVHEQDTVATLDGRAAGVAPFQVRLRRTRPAPWPPVRAF
jgi:hypothetical protein